MVSVVRLWVIDNNIRTHPNQKIKIEFNTFVSFISECMYVCMSECMYICWTKEKNDVMMGKVEAGLDQTTSRGGHLRSPQIYDPQNNCAVE